MQLQRVHPGYSLLGQGFSADDGRELGHWRRYAKGAGGEAVESADHAQALPRPRGRSNPAAAPETLAARQNMENAYSRGEGRLGERGAQLRVRGRFMGLVQAAHLNMSRPWQELPDGPQGWQVLFHGFAEDPSVSDSEHHDDASPDPDED